MEKSYSMNDIDERIKQGAKEEYPDIKWKSVQSIHEEKGFIKGAKWLNALYDGITPDEAKAYKQYYDSILNWDDVKPKRQ